jgi:hypothetical protein
MVLLCVQLPYAEIAFAKEVRFIPHASLSVTKYEVVRRSVAKGLPDGTSFPEISLDYTYKFLGVGGTLFKNSYYLDMFYQRSSDEASSFSVDNPTIPDSVLSAVFNGRRRDYSLTLGKKILDGQAGIYVGYKEGKSGGPQPQGDYLSFEEKGFFIGGNYGWLISDLGVISLNLAYAKMDGNRTQKRKIVYNGQSITLDFNGNGDTDGLSYGVAWASRITEYLSYSVGLEVRRYSFDNIKDVNPEKYSFTDNIEETFSGITVSTYYSF